MVASSLSPLPTPGASEGLGSSQASFLGWVLDTALVKVGGSCLHLAFHTLSLYTGPPCLLYNTRTHTHTLTHSHTHTLTYM